MSDPLLDLGTFVLAHPPERGWKAGAETLAYRSAQVRVAVRFERSADIGAALWRRDELADRGVYCADHDSKSFAAGLVNAVADELSIRDLENVVAAFQAELDTQLRSRSAALAARSV